MLEEAITETQWAAWKQRFDRYSVSCKLSDKDIQNRIFETIPASVAHQIEVDLSGWESKYEIFAKIRFDVLKKRSIFLYRKNFHELKQSRGEDPKRFAARIKQLAPSCRFTADGGTPQYGPFILSTIFVLGLENSCIS